MWCAISKNKKHGFPEFVLVQHSQSPILFTFEDEFRDDATTVIAALMSSGIQAEILSDDREAAVARTAQRLGIESCQAGVTPQAKLAYITASKMRVVKFSW